MGAESGKAGKIYGFPLIKGGHCQSQLKMPPMRKIERGNICYIGIAADEPNRFHNLTDRKARLVEHDITEARKICEELDLLSPIYKAHAAGVGFAITKALTSSAYFASNTPNIGR